MTQSLYLERSLVWHINLTSVRNTSKAETGWGLQVSTTEHGKLNRGWRPKKKVCVYLFPPFLPSPNFFRNSCSLCHFLGCVYPWVPVCSCTHRCVHVQCTCVCVCVRAQVCMFVHRRAVCSHMHVCQACWGECSEACCWTEWIRIGDFDQQQGTGYLKHESPSGPLLPYASSQPPTHAGRTRRVFTAESVERCGWKGELGGACISCSDMQVSCQP